MTATLTFMLRFKNTSHLPPGGFRFKDPDTGAEIDAQIWGVWRDKINRHRDVNNLAPIDIALAEDQNCSRLPPSAASTFCESDEPMHTVDGVTLNSSDIIRGTRTILAFKLAGSPLVSDEEAVIRAEICAYCPMNVQFRMPCSGMCGELLEVVNQIVGSKPTPKNGDLHACAVCKCSLPAKIWIPEEILRKYETEDIKTGYPHHCWLSNTEANHA